jgi:hypothetical protein
MLTVTQLISHCQFQPNILEIKYQGVVSTADTFTFSSVHQELSSTYFLVAGS